MYSRDYVVLARVRRSLRALNTAIQRGAESAGLAMQEQALLLALAARGGKDVPFAALREDLITDQATASELLRRLVRRGLVKRVPAADRRAATIGLTTLGAARFRSSLTGIRAQIRRASRGGELEALGNGLQEYLALAFPRH